MTPSTADLQTDAFPHPAAELRDVADLQRLDVEELSEMAAMMDIPLRSDYLKRDIIALIAEKAGLGSSEPTSKKTNRHDTVLGNASLKSHNIAVPDDYVSIVKKASIPAVQKGSTIVTRPPQPSVHISSPRAACSLHTGHSRRLSPPRGPDMLPRPRHRASEVTTPVNYLAATPRSSHYVADNGSPIPIKLSHSRTSGSQSSSSRHSVVTNSTSSRVQRAVKLTTSPRSASPCEDESDLPIASYDDELEDRHNDRSSEEEQAADAHRESQADESFDFDNSEYATFSDLFPEYSPPSSPPASPPSSLLDYTSTLEYTAEPPETFTGSMSEWLDVLYLTVCEEAAIVEALVEHIRERAEKALAETFLSERTLRRLERITDKFEKEIRKRYGEAYFQYYKQQIAEEDGDASDEETLPVPPLRRTGEAPVMERIDSHASQRLAESEEEYHTPSLSCSPEASGHRSGVRGRKRSRHDDSESGQYDGNWNSPSRAMSPNDYRRHPERRRSPDWGDLKANMHTESSFGDLDDRDYFRSPKRVRLDTSPGSGVRYRPDDWPIDYSAYPSPPRAPSPSPEPIIQAAEWRARALAGRLSCQQAQTTMSQPADEGPVDPKLDSQPTAAETGVKVEEKRVVPIPRDLVRAWRARSQSVQIQPQSEASPQDPQAQLAQHDSEVIDESPLKFDSASHSGPINRRCTQPYPSTRSRTRAQSKQAELNRDHQAVVATRRAPPIPRNVKRRADSNAIAGGSGLTKE